MARYAAVPRKLGTVSVVQEYKYAILVQLVQQRYLHAVLQEDEDEDLRTGFSLL